MATNNSYNLEHQFHEDVKKAEMNSGSQSCSSQSSPKASNQKSGCFKRCLLMLVILLLITMAIAGFIYFSHVNSVPSSGYPLDITDLNVAKAMIGELSNAADSEFNMLRFMFNLEKGGLLAKKYEKHRFHIPVLYEVCGILDTSTKKGSGWEILLNQRSISGRTYIESTEAEQRTKMFSFFMSPEIYARYAKKANKRPGYFQCAEMTVTPAYISDPIIAGPTGHLVFIVDEDSSFAPLDNCDTLIRDMQIRSIKLELGRYLRLTHNWDKVDSNELKDFLNKRLSVLQETTHDCSLKNEVIFQLDLRTIDGENEYLLTAMNTTRNFKISFSSENIRELSNGTLVINSFKVEKLPK